MLVYMFISILLMVVLFLCVPKPNKWLMMMSFIVSLVYIICRVKMIPSSGWPLIFGILLYGAEVWGFLQFLIFCYVSTQEKQEVKLDTSRTSLPSIDVIIPTYGEPIYILKRTLAAVISLKYEAGKKEIYVCDDGKRSEVKQLCEDYGVHFVVRADNTDAKSGNINHILQFAQGELMVVFDADMMPKTNFLLKMVPYFFDESVGFVQAPQTFYNPDIFQKVFSNQLPSEQDFFMRDIQPKRASLNSAIHVGTNAIFRRRCIDEIGGYPTFSITEDIAVGVMIEAKGYKGIYVNEALVLGLNPTNLKDFLGQRNRWCRGNLQLLKYKNPLTMKGLRLGQRLVYFDGICYWYTSLLKMLFTLAPLLFLLTGIFFINVPIQNLIYLFVPYFISQYIVFTCSYSRTRTMFWGHIYEMILAPYLSFSCLKHLFGTQKLEFKVTNKSKQENFKSFRFKEVWPHCFLVVLTLAAWVIGYVKLEMNELTLSVFLINLVWSIYNSIPMILAIMLGMDKAEDSDSEVIIDEPCYVTLKTASSLVKYKVYSLSYSQITVFQKQEQVLLEGETLTFTFNGDELYGKVMKSTHGKATLDILSSTSGAFCDTLALYIDHLKPFFNLDMKTKEGNRLVLNEKGAIEWEIQE